MPNQRLEQRLALKSLFAKRDQGAKAHLRGEIMRYCDEFPDILKTPDHGANLRHPNSIGFQFVRVSSDASGSISEEPASERFFVGCQLITRRAMLEELLPSELIPIPLHDGHKLVIALGNNRYCAFREGDRFLDDNNPMRTS